jgi:hypothetical protein
MVEDEVSQVSLETLGLKFPEAKWSALRYLEGVSSSSLNHSYHA